MLRLISEHQQPMILPKNIKVQQKLKENISADLNARRPLFSQTVKTTHPTRKEQSTIEDTG